MIRRGRSDPLDLAGFGVDAGELAGREVLEQVLIVRAGEHVLKRGHLAQAARALLHVGADRERGVPPAPGPRSSGTSVARMWRLSDSQVNERVSTSLSRAPAIGFARPVPRRRSRARRHRRDRGRRQSSCRHGTRPANGWTPLPAM